MIRSVRSTEGGPAGTLAPPSGARTVGGVAHRVGRRIGRFRIGCCRIRRGVRPRNWGRCRARALLVPVRTPPRGLGLARKPIPD
jgi:hypothetical protein